MLYQQCTCGNHESRPRAGATQHPGALSPWGSTHLHLFAAGKGLRRQPRLAGQQHSHSRGAVGQGMGVGRLLENAAGQDGA